MYSRVKDWPDAEENINKAIELSTKSEDKDYALFVAGSIYERQKKYDKAEEAFHKVLAERSQERHDPELSRLHAGRPRHPAG